MRLKGWKKWVAAIFGIVFVFVLITTCLCVFLGIRSKMDAVGYYCMIQEDFHPIWKDLALRRIKKGDSIEIVLKKYTPVRRYDFPPYVNLQFEEPFSGLVIAAKDGKLIYAGAGSCCWEHTFFKISEEEEKYVEAYATYLKQVSFERKAYRVHLAAANGQDVFISRQIKRSEVPARELQIKYNIPVSANSELTVEVSQVVYGDLKSGDILSFPGDECSGSDMNEPETVFLCFNDSKTIFPNSPSHQVYTTVPKEALDWYQGLSKVQIKAFVARVLARQPKSDKQLQ
jgi:hypothetical protein